MKARVLRAKALPFDEVSIFAKVLTDGLDGFTAAEEAFSAWLDTEAQHIFRIHLNRRIQCV